MLAIGSIIAEKDSEIQGGNVQLWCYECRDINAV